MKNPSLDQTKGQSEGDQARKSIKRKQLKVSSLTRFFLRCDLISTKSTGNLLNQRSMVQGLMIWNNHCIKSSTHEMMMWSPVRETKFLEVYGVRYKLSTTSMPTGEHITRVQNVRHSMDMLPTWKLQKMSTQDTESLLLPVSRSWSSLVTNIWKRLLFEGRTINYTGKLTNLNLDERFALNVALRMYTRRIVIKERVEDL
ncbi:hypothetical protein Tco_1055553 [Tanacetum coccineum]|uniref:F-box domain-containing protein n=1 Tax=Tanacetum coccineum TaxID=301880 RepID=A0ABQ5H009_9ASTR